MHNVKLFRLHELLQEVSALVFHGLVVLVSAAIAWSLPSIARHFLAFWSRVEHEQMLLLSIEVGVALFLVAGSNYLWQAFRDRRQAVMARGAGLVSFFPHHDPGAGRKIRQLKQQQSLGRTVLAIGVTGHGTVVGDKTELHALLETCLEAKLILLNPLSEEAARRAQSLSNPDISPARFRQELQETIALIKRFRANGKVIRLKLYSDRPHLRMVILGDYLWLQHYHTGLDIRWMPEYVFQHNIEHHGLYTLFYQYFTKRWENQDIPEYDFQTDELVYRTRNGSELRRESFEFCTSEEWDAPGHVGCVTLNYGRARTSGTTGHALTAQGWSVKGTPPEAHENCDCHRCMASTDQRGCAHPWENRRTLTETRT